MSNSEIAPESSPFFSYVMPALTTAIPNEEGSAVNLSAIPNYNGATSKIVGIRLVTAIGTPGSVCAVQGGQPGDIATNVAGYATIRVISQQVPGIDQSVYRVYWTNEVAQSQLVTVQPC